MHISGGKNLHIDIQKKENFKLKFAQATQMILKSAFVVLWTIIYHAHNDP